MDSSIWNKPFTPLSFSRRVEYDAGSSCDGLVNLTPHPLAVDFEDERDAKCGLSFNALTLPSHGVARVESERVVGIDLRSADSIALWVPDCLVPVSVQAYRYGATVKVTLAAGEEVEIGKTPYFAPVEPAPEGLWQRAQGPRIYFVVSLLTGVVLRGHPNLLVPGPEIRDGEGRIIGCRNLRRVV